MKEPFGAKPVRSYTRSLRWIVPNHRSEGAVMLAAHKTSRISSANEGRLR
jgi:hypothetical protein